MAVEWKGANFLTCLSTDTKPLATLVPLNTRAYETNTDDIYRSDGTSWVALIANDKTETVTNKTFDHISNASPHIGSANYTVLYDNLISGTSKYRLRNNQTGVIDAQGTTLDAVVPTALTAMESGLILASGAYGKGGSIYIPAGRHVLSAGFTGFEVPTMTRFTMAPNCALYVPDGYTGYVLHMNPINDQSYVHTIIEGGYIRENAGSGPLAQHDWSGIKLECHDDATTNSISFCEIRDTVIAYGKNGIEFFNDAPSGLGWINGNTFSHISLLDNENAINFNNNGQILNPINLYGFVNRNVFIGCRSQALDVSINGVKDIIGISNVFIDCTMWDYHAHANAAIARSCNIVGGASRTTFIGGAMGLYRFKDDVGDTIMIDSLTSIVPGLLQTPTNRRWGTWTGTNTSSGVTNGLISGMTNDGTPTQVLDNSLGSRTRFTTAATAASPAGNRYAATFTYRTFNPKMKVQFSLQQSSNQRLWIGFCGSTGTPSLDTYTDNKRFFGLALRAADTNWHIAHNDGSATTTWINTTRAVNTTVHTLYLVADEENARWGYMFDQTQRYPTWLTTNVPGNTTALCFIAEMETSVGTAKSIELYNIEVECDK